MKSYVFDTSALIRLYVPDGPLPNGAIEALEQASPTEALLLIPELAVAEVGQVIRKKEQRSELRPADVNEILAAFLALPLQSVGHLEIIEPALALARRHRLTVYDAIVFAVALEHNAELITADERLQTAFRKAKT